MASSSKKDDPKAGAKVEAMTAEAPLVIDTLEEALEVGYLGVTQDDADHTFTAQVPPEAAAPVEEEEA